MLHTTLHGSPTLGHDPKAYALETSDWKIMAFNLLMDWQLRHDRSCINSMVAEAQDGFYMWFPIQSHYPKSTHNLDDILAVGFDGWLIWEDCLIIHQ